MRDHIVTISLISFLSVLVYSNTFYAEFNFDDRPNIVNNTKDHLYAFTTQGLRNVLWQARPVAHLSFAMNYYYGRLDVFGYHAVNILLHTAAAILLYFLILSTLRLQTVKERYGQVSHRVAWIGTLLWTVHPIQTQAVNLVVQRMTLLAALFSMISILCYVKARHSGGQMRIVLYGLSFLALLLGLGSKENVAVLPAFILLYEVFFISTFQWNLVRRAVVPVSILFLIVPLFIFGSYLKLQPDVWETVPRLFTTQYLQGPYTLSFDQRFLTECRIMIHYLSLIYFPHPLRLNLDYDYPVSYSILDPVSTLPSVLFVVGTILLAFFTARRLSIVSFSIFWFYGNLAIESLLFKLDLLYEHRLYLPSMAIMILLAVGIEKMWSQKLVYYGRIWRSTLAGGGVVILSLLCFWTYERNLAWLTAESLWEDTVKKSPDKPRAHHSLADAYSRQGKFELALKETQEALRLRPDYTAARVHLGYLHQMRGDLDLAVQEYENALKENSKWYLALYNLGAIYFTRGQLHLSIETLERAIEMRPEGYEAHYYLGEVYASNGKVDLAIQELEESIRLNPEFIAAYNLLGELYTSQGQLEEAIGIYKRAVELDPQAREIQVKLENIFLKVGQSPQVASQTQLRTSSEVSSSRIEYERGIDYQKEGRWGEAIQHYRESIKLDPSAAVVHYQLGLALYQRGQIEEAIKAYRTAAERDSRIKELHFNLGLALQKMGRITESLDAYEEAIRLNPENFDAHYNLAWIYQRLEKPEDALLHYEECLRLNMAHPEVHNNLGVLYAGKGSLDLAIQEFTAAVSNRPDHIQARYNLARALQLVGRKQEAIVEYEQLLAYQLPDGMRNRYQEQAELELKMLKAMK